MPDFEDEFEECLSGIGKYYGHPMYYIRLALIEKFHQFKKKNTRWRSQGFNRCLQELTHSIEQWYSNLNEELLSPFNWNFGKLKSPSGTNRKPKLHVDTNITSKDNLVVEWLLAETSSDPYPQDKPYHLINNSDFLSVSSRARGWEEPLNRLVMIRGFGELWKYVGESESEVLATNFLMQAGEAHVKDVVSHLSQNFEIEEDLKMHLEEVDGKLRPIVTRANERAQATEKKEKERIHEASLGKDEIENITAMGIFKKHLIGISLNSDAILKAIQDSNSDYKLCASMLSKQSSEKIFDFQVERVYRSIKKKCPNIWKVYFETGANPIVDE